MLKHHMIKNLCIFTTEKGPTERVPQQAPDSMMPEKAMEFL